MPLVSVLGSCDYPKLGASLRGRLVQAVLFGQCTFWGDDGTEGVMGVRVSWVMGYGLLLRCCLLRMSLCHFFIMLLGRYVGLVLEVPEDSILGPGLLDK